MLDRPHLSLAGDDSIRISWSHSTLPSYGLQGPVRYLIEVSEPPTHSWKRLVGGLTEPFYTIRNVNRDKDYMYRVRAENDYGTSEASLPVSTHILRRPVKPDEEMVFDKGV